MPAIAANKDDLEIVNGTTWNENIVCVRDVVTTSDNYRGLLFQQPYGAIAQLPDWSAGFSVSGTHTIYNAFEFLNAAGQFYFDKTAGTLYYYPRAGENMATADVEAPVVETILAIAGASNASRVKNLTFQGITFANTDYSLYAVAGSHGKATVQGATVFIAYGDGNWHNSKYEITDTLPGMITREQRRRDQLRRQHDQAQRQRRDLDDQRRRQLDGRRQLHHRHRGQRHHRRASPARLSRRHGRPREVRRRAWKGSARTIRSPTTSSTTSARSPDSAVTPASPRSS